MIPRKYVVCINNIYHAGIEAVEIGNPIQINSSMNYLSNTLQ